MTVANACVEHARSGWHVPEPPEHTSPVLRTDFIAALRPLSHTVAVITTDGPAGRAGATVSSFCSVSADPPRMLACLDRTSRVPRCVRANGVFCLNVLASEQMPIARRFSGAEDGAVAERFDGIELLANGVGVPIIGGAAALVCRVRSAELSATHRIVIGDVVALTGAIARSLTYADGAYGAER